MDHNESEKDSTKQSEMNQGNGLITISLSIQYVTTFGQEIYVNFDDYTCKKLSWTPGHVWIGSVNMTRPRTMHWWYSVYEGGKEIRVEQNQQRSYKFSKRHSYYHIFDRWDNRISSVSPLSFSNNTKFTPSSGMTIRSTVNMTPRKQSGFITLVSPCRIKTVIL